MSNLSNIDNIESKETKRKEAEEQKEGNKREIKKILAEDYFNGKHHKFNVTETQARSNSTFTDKLTKEINEENKSEKLKVLKKEIEKQYKETTGSKLNLTENQLSAIINAHRQKGTLGQLTKPQLRKKVKILSETIKDKDIRRFLLETGFCGRWESLLGIEENEENEYEQLYLNGTYVSLDTYGKVRGRIRSFDIEKGEYMVIDDNRGTYYVKENEISQWPDDDDNENNYDDPEEDIAIATVIETPQKYPNGSEAYLTDQQGGKRKVKILDFNPENGEYQISDPENPLKIYFVLEYQLSPIK